MILLIDNYDSFSYNLVQMIGSISPDIRVVRNDKVTVEDINGKCPPAIWSCPRDPDIQRMPVSWNRRCAS